MSFSGVFFFLLLFFLLPGRAHGLRLYDFPRAIRWVNAMLIERARDAGAATLRARSRWCKRKVSHPSGLEVTGKRGRRRAIVTASAERIIPLDAGAPARFVCMQKSAIDLPPVQKATESHNAGVERPAC